MSVDLKNYPDLNQYSLLFNSLEGNGNILLANGKYGIKPSLDPVKYPNIFNSNYFSFFS